MMIKQPESKFSLLGTLQTWVVGVQYYEGGEEAVGAEIWFERDPENPADANALGVYHGEAGEAELVGHLPRYDAQFFSPLIEEGAVLLKGEIPWRPPVRQDLLPLKLEIYATEKVARVFQIREEDHPKAVRHNLLVDLWKKQGHYSANTLEVMRSELRSAAHDGCLYPESQFIYRLLKGVIEWRRNAPLREVDAIYQDWLEGVHFGAGLGWPGFEVIPLYEKPEARAGQPSLDDETTAEVVETEFHKNIPPATLRKYAPYPEGALGLAVCTRRGWMAFCWSEDPADAEVLWYKTLLDTPYFNSDTWEDPDLEIPLLSDWLERHRCEEAGEAPVFRYERSSELRLQLEENRITRVGLLHVRYEPVRRSQSDGVVYDVGEG